MTTGASSAAACVLGFQLSLTVSLEPRKARSRVAFLPAWSTCSVLAASMGSTSTFMFSSGMVSSSVVMAEDGILKPRMLSPGWVTSWRTKSTTSVRRPLPLVSRKYCPSWTWSSGAGPLASLAPAAGAENSTFATATSPSPMGTCTHLSDRMSTVSSNCMLASSAPTVPVNREVEIR